MRRSRRSATTSTSGFRPARSSGPVRTRLGSGRWSSWTRWAFRRRDGRASRRRRRCHLELARHGPSLPGVASIPGASSASSSSTTLPADGTAEALTAAPPGVRGRPARARGGPGRRLQPRRRARIGRARALPQRRRARRARSRCRRWSARSRCAAGRGRRGGPARRPRGRRHPVRSTCRSRSRRSGPFAAMLARGAAACPRD